MIVALIASGLLIGVALGGLGAGGSILAVPALVYVADLSASSATATSLVAVGSAAAVAAVSHRRHVRLGIASWFVPTGLLGSIAGHQLGNRLADDALLVIFSTLMLLAASRLITRRSPAPRTLSAAANTVHVAMKGCDVRAAGSVVAAGTAVGVLTGLLGVGGGFVIIPALTLALGLTMPDAVATSLVVVAANAAIGLLVRGTDTVNWPAAITLTTPMLIGSAIGARALRGVDERATSNAFVVLLVVVALLNAAAVLA